MKIITDIKPRVNTQNSRWIGLPIQYFYDKEGLKMKAVSLDWMLSYTVRDDDKIHAKQLSIDLYLLLEKGTKVTSIKVQKILNELFELRELTSEEMTPLQRWDSTSESMPGDIAGNYKKQTSEILTEKCTGEILESMCGFNSYIFPHLDKNVTAQDYSQGMLTKYEYPKRRRLQFNLNGLPRKKLLITNEYFDTITFVKGYKYIKSINQLFSEFNRLLKPNGKLIFVESPSAGYRDLTVRKLNILKCKDELTKNGFEINNINHLRFKFEKIILFETTKK